METEGIDLAGIIGSMGQQAPAANASGFEGIGQHIAGLMGGGSAGSQQSYSRGANDGLSVVKKQLEARKMRDEAMARDKLYRRLVDSGIDPEQAAVLESVSIGGMGSDFSGGTTGLKNMQEVEMREKAAAAADPMVRNQLLSAINGKPNDLTKIEGGVAYDPTVAPTAQMMQITPAAAADDVRQSMVAGSQISRNQASAAEYDRRVPKTSRDYVSEHAAKKQVDALYKEYETKIAEASTPEAKAQLTAEREEKVAAAAVSGAMATRGSEGYEDASRAANMWADDMAAAGMAPTPGEVQEAVRRYMSGQALSVAPIETTNDGTRPPEIIDTDGKPLGGEPARGVSFNRVKSSVTPQPRPSSSSARAPKSELPPPIDYQNGGNAGDSATTIPPAARAKLRPGVNTTFANGQVWTMKDGAPVRVK